MSILAQLRADYAHVADGYFQNRTPIQTEFGPLWAVPGIVPLSEILSATPEVISPPDRIQFLVQFSSGAVRTLQVTVQEWEHAYDSRSPIRVDMARLPDAANRSGGIRVVNAEGELVSSAVAIVVGEAQSSHVRSYGREILSADRRGRIRLAHLQPDQTYRLHVCDTESDDAALIVYGPDDLGGGLLDVALGRPRRFRTTLRLARGAFPRHASANLKTRSYVGAPSLPCTYDPETGQLSAMGVVVDLYDVEIVAYDSNPDSVTGLFQPIRVRVSAAVADGTEVTLP